jgi:hypothetical protein
MILLAPGLNDLEASDTKDLDRLVSVSYADTTEDIASTSSKVKRVKALLATDAGTIELHDLLTSEVRRFLSLTSEDAFPHSGQFSQSEFVSRLERYEVAVADLTLLLACVAHWGRPAHFATLQKCIARSSDRLESTSGLTVWLALRWYPLLLELYCTGVAAIDARRYDSLAAVFNASIPRSEYQRTSDTLLDAASEALLELIQTNVLKLIPGHERNHTPLSEYLLKILQPRLDDALFLGKNYESAFDMFEVYFALSVADARLARGESVWGPIGRFGWKRSRENSPLQRVLKEAETHQTDWLPLKAGLFGGNFDRFKKVAEQFVQFISRLPWY